MTQSELDTFVRQVLANPGTMSADLAAEFPDMLTFAQELRDAAVLFAADMESPEVMTPGCLTIVDERNILKAT